MSDGLRFRVLLLAATLGSCGTDVYFGDGMSASGGATGGSGGASAGAPSAGAAAGTSCPTWGEYPVAREPGSDRCFVLPNDTFYYSLEEALQACQRLGPSYSLASLRSEAQGSAAAEVVGRVEPGSPILAGLVQMSDAAAMDQGWSWVDGSPDGFGTYIGWAAGEPNDGNDELEDGTEQCVVFGSSGLADHYCELGTYPLCAGPL